MFGSGESSCVTRSAPLVFTELHLEFQLIVCLTVSASLFWFHIYIPYNYLSFVQIHTTSLTIFIMNLLQDRHMNPAVICPLLQFVAVELEVVSAAS